MNQIYVAESKKISGPEVFGELYSFIEQNFGETNMEYYGYYLLNTFSNESNGKVCAKKGFENNYDYISAQTPFKSGLHSRLKAFDYINGDKGILMTIYDDRNVETPHILISEKNNIIQKRVMHAQNPLLEQKIREIYDYMMRKVREH